jgi:hypothetical protein
MTGHRARAKSGPRCSRFEFRPIARRPEYHRLLQRRREVERPGLPGEIIETHEAEGVRAKTHRQQAPDAQVTFRGARPKTLRERDVEALELKPRLRAVSRRIERRKAPGRLWRRHKPAAAIALGAAGAYAGSLHTGWPVPVVLKHAASFPNCAAAWSMGQAPALRGEPGYWRSHDADRDGIACEWRPGT